MNESNNIYLKIQIKPKISVDIVKEKKNNNCKYIKLPNFFNNKVKKELNIFDKLGNFDFFEL